MKSSDKEFRLIALDLFDLYLDILAAHISPIRLSASVLTPTEHIGIQVREILQPSY